MTDLLIQIVVGAIGGNVADMFLNFGSGTGIITNTVGGIIGGGVGANILGSLGVGSGSKSSNANLGGIISNVAGSFVGGGVLLAIVKVVAPLVGLDGITGN